MAGRDANLRGNKREIFTINLQNEGEINCVDCTLYTL